MPEHLLDLAAAGQPLRAAKSAAAKPRTSETGQDNGPDLDANSPFDNELEVGVFTGIPAETGAEERMRPAGLEPATYGLKVRCSTN